MLRERREQAKYHYPCQSGQSRGNENPLENDG